MKSYTFMSDEGVEAAIAANTQTGEKFPIELSPSEYGHMLRCLQYVWNEAGETYPQLADWAGSFGSTMAESVGVEFI